MENPSRQRRAILEATLRVFNQKGLKFTMDDIARAQGISKKTIYTVFRDKEEMFLALVDYIFDAVKEAEQAILQNDALDTKTKLREVLRVIPERYREVDFRQLYSLKEKYPTIYRQVELRLETGWEETIDLLNRGMEEGTLRPVSIPLVKLMLEAVLEQFFQRDILVQNGLTYQQALNEVVDVLLFGIEEKSAKSAKSAKQAQ
jgi:AcrR family transcriptional regulator